MLKNVAVCLKGKVLSLFFFSLLSPALFAGSIAIQTPSAGVSISGPVAFTAAATESRPFHYEVWDNGAKVGDFSTPRLNASAQLTPGLHNTTIEAVTSQGVILEARSVTYMVQGQIPGGIHISSPVANQSTTSAVRITASGAAGTSYHLEVWDNDNKLGDVFAGTVDTVYVLPNGTHTLTVQSIAPSGKLIDKQTVTYLVAESCSGSDSSQCDLDRLLVDNTQGNCDPQQTGQWVANPCGYGIQGDEGADPVRTAMENLSENKVLTDQGNLTLNGTALHLMEFQGSQPSNVLFRGQSPYLIKTAAPESHWQLSEYVYLPDPTAHQAFEMDAQYTFNGVWTKFYTECAFNINAGTGYWGVFDATTGGWIFLNGKPQGGQTPPVVPCNRSQFAQPWAGSANPSFTGWHHIAWQFLRNDDGTVTYQSLTFDGTTTQVNFHPNTTPGGQVSDSGNFGALVQLDGVVNRDRTHDLVEAYVNEITLTHQP